MKKWDEHERHLEVYIEEVEGRFLAFYLNFLFTNL